MRIGGAKVTKKVHKKEQRGQYHKEFKTQPKSTKVKKKAGSQKGK